MVTWRVDLEAELIALCEQAIGKLERLAPKALNPDLPPHPECPARRVQAGYLNARSKKPMHARLEIDVGHVEFEWLFIGKPSTNRWFELLLQIWPNIHECRTGSAAQPFEHTCCENINVQLLHVDRNNAGGLVRIHHDQRTNRMRM